MGAPQHLGGGEIAGDAPTATMERLEPRMLLSGSAMEVFAASPALFVENQGQWSLPGVRYAFQGSGANVLHTDTGPVFQVFSRGEEDGPTEAVQFAVRFDGAEATVPVGLDRSESVFHYYLGEQSNWRPDVPAYRTVAYFGLYEGIDLYTWGQRDSLKYEFHVAPGADPGRILARYEGIEGLSVDAAGALHVRTAVGELVDEAPTLYQDLPGGRVEVAGRFAAIGDSAVGFVISGAYDPEAELVIDPNVAWSTYVGGISADEARGIAADGSRNLLVVGDTDSLSWVSGGYDTIYNFSGDAFVTKIGPTGQHVWSTYVGGTAPDTGRAVAVDSSDNVFVTGETQSSGWVSSGYDTSYNGGNDAFVVKISSAGTHVWSTYVGGSGHESGLGVATDSSGNVLVVGDTQTSGWISGGYDTSYNGGDDAFVAKLSSAGAHTWSTYVGGSGRERSAAIAVDSTDSALVTGDTESTGWVSGGYDTSYNGGRDAFAVKVSSAGTQTWSTYLGGDDFDQGHAIAVDSSDNVLVAGQTQSSSGGWVSGGYDTTLNGGVEAFAAKLSSAGAHTWSTYVGGNSTDVAYGVAAGVADSLVVVGETLSAGWVSGGPDTTYNSSGDGFVVRVTAAGAHRWSTYLGGISSDIAYGVTVDTADSAAVAGQTTSSTWPSGGYDTSYNLNGDGFVAKFTPGRGADSDFDGDGMADLLWRHNGGSNQIWFMDGATVQSTGNVQAAGDGWSVGGVGYFDGDDKADILWRHTSGGNQVWLMDGSTPTSAVDLPGVTDSRWRIAGVGDFNGDDKADVLWRHADGMNHIWFMDGTTVSSTADIPSVAGSAWRIAGVGDFNADGKADIFWRHAAGANQIWTMDGGTVSSTADVQSVTQPEWQVGQIGDFDADGDADLLWRHDGGADQMWLMNNATTSSTTDLQAIDATWQLIGTQILLDPAEGDFDWNGKGDLLWRHTTGQNQLWSMNAQTILSPLTVQSVSDANWTAAGVGDFDGDYRADILWRHTNGSNQIWFMSAADILSTAGVTTVPDANWSVGDVGDFDGDGKADILWRHTNGTNQIWFMNGATVSSVANPQAVADANWSIGGVGDFDGDGKADILWRHTNGTNQLWYMDGATTSSTASVQTVSDTNWSVGAVADLDGDGMADILWRRSSGENQIWFMSGTTIKSFVNALTVADASWDVI